MSSRMSASGMLLAVVVMVDVVLIDGVVPPNTVNVAARDHSSLNGLISGKLKKDNTLAKNRSLVPVMNVNRVMQILRLTMKNSRSLVSRKENCALVCNDNSMPSERQDLIGYLEADKIAQKNGCECPLSIGYLDLNAPIMDPKINLAPANAL